MTATPRRGWWGRLVGRVVPRPAGRGGPQPQMPPPDPPGSGVEAPPGSGLEAPLGSGLEAVFTPAPPPASAVPLEIEDAETTPSRTGFEVCPLEGRTTAHFFHSDGSRTCCWCQTRTEGDHDHD